MDASNEPITSAPLRITIPARATLNSKNAGREITAGVENESRQIFNVMLLASPRSTDESWPEWSTPRQRFDGSKPAPEDQYLVRYRVRFASEYSPTPPPESSPSAEEAPTPNESSPEPTATPD